MFPYLTKNQAKKFRLYTARDLKKVTKGMVDGYLFQKALNNNLIRSDEVYDKTKLESPALYQVVKGTLDDFCRGFGTYFMSKGVFFDKAVIYKVMLDGIMGGTRWANSKGKRRSTISSNFSKAFGKLYNHPTLPLPDDRWMRPYMFIPKGGVAGNVNMDEGTLVIIKDVSLPTDKDAVYAACNSRYDKDVHLTDPTDPKSTTHARPDEWFTTKDDILEKALSWKPRKSIPPKPGRRARTKTKEPEKKSGPDETVEKIRQAQKSLNDETNRTLVVHLADVFSGKKDKQSLLLPLTMDICRWIDRME